MALERVPSADSLALGKRPLCDLVTVTIAILKGNLVEQIFTSQRSRGRVGSGLGRRGEYIAYFLFCALILPLLVYLYFMVKTLKAKPVHVGNITLP